MPVNDYGVWKGMPVHYEYEDRYEDPKSPHLSLYYHDNHEMEPQFDRQFRQKHKHKPPNKSRPKEIPGLFRAAINIKSVDRDSRLAYWVNYNIVEHPIVQKLADLDFGFHSLEELDGQGLDYIRSGLFDTKSGRVLPHDIPGPNNDIIDVLVPEIQQSIEKQADIYIFGSCFNTRNGMHNVHMNQGNIEKFRQDDGIFQDGGLLIHYKDTGLWTGLFLAFASQAMHTDNRTGHAISPLTWGAFLPKELTENSVAIKEAFIKKRKSVTLANLTSHKVSLTSWQLHNSAGQVQGLPGDAALNSMATRSFEVPNLPLSDDGDTITLLNEHGLKVDGLPSPKGPNSPVARHEAALLTEAKNHLIEFGGMRRSEDFNRNILPLSRPLIQAIGHRMALEAAKGTNIDSKLRALYESGVILEDSAWYTEQGGISRRAQREMEAQAADALLPNLEKLVYETGAAIQ
ncbi:hypothetical protein Asppvi_009898 [Aspergillus pseudoviridinutans]|uniref:Uncharacterized protein n=1 Tax=Aspergillus pseudoviridinutans TaxID=1517512 RepID=A0A9P3BM88_9EURO|nr:uncharacterized protein Asppvi_009898 [Aspergillus pseudoviridinutans]GIJ90933.1 hypothetical protein Asppvi_009898 [Aspergillus pseudoviridinutans]